MKKNLSIFFCLLAWLMPGKVAGAATELWSGTTTYDTSWTMTTGSPVELTAAQLAGASAGDELTFTFTVPTNAGSCVQLYKSDWTGTVSADAYVNPSYGDTSATLTLTSEMLSELQANGCYVTGCNVTIRRVSLEAATTTTVVLWSGTSTYDTSWAKTAGETVELTAAQLAGASVDDELVITLTVPEDAWSRVQLWNHDWTADALVSADSYAEPSYGDTSVRITLTSEMLSELKANGCYVTGCNIAISQVSLITANSGGGASGGGEVDGMRHVTYTEHYNNIPNPERGVFHHLEFSSRDGNRLTAEQLQQYRADDNITLVFTEYVLADFLYGDISNAFLERIRSNMQVLRNNGAKCVLRFAYSNDQGTQPWDAAWSVTSRHMDQLSPILSDYVDVIALVEAGFVGCWGEWYYTSNYGFEPSTYEDYGPRRTLLAKLLSVVPPERFVSVRYPEAKLNGLTPQITRSDVLTDATAYSGTAMSRLGFHNDCFLANEVDMGTFHDPVAESREYWKKETKYVPMGGETCAEPNNYTLAANARKDLAAYHWSYMNQDYYGSVIESWKTAGLWAEIFRRLGYRFVLTDGYFTPNPQAGQTFSTTLRLKNVGWAAPFNPRPVQLIVARASDGAEMVRQTLDENPRYWFADQTQTIEASFTLPATMALGDYDVFLNLPDPKPTLADNPYYSIQLANNDVWVAEKGYNKLTTISVTGYSPVTSVGLEETLPQHQTGTYNLQGVRVDDNHLRSGIYIRNGKKFVVK